MWRVNTGMLRGVPVVAAASGCGKLNAALAAQMLADCCSISALLFVGLAGSLAPEVEVLDTVVCTEASFHDTEEEIYTDFPVLPRPVFPADGALLSAARRAAERQTGTVHFGPATTGDRWTEWFHTGSLCVDMETAAAAHACHLNQIPFLGVRVISDRNEAGKEEAILRNYDRAGARICSFTKTLVAELGRLDTEK